MSQKLTQEERDLFQALHENRVVIAKAINHPDMVGIKNNVSDIYSEKAHFVYELIQNADDTLATKITFELYKDHLVFRHNGKIQFSISEVKDEVKEKDIQKRGHINAITSIGASNKSEDKNKIGKFGIGFKAVFEYCSEPEIYDDKFWFKIKDYIIPILLDQDYPDRKKGETLFVFKFKNDKAFTEIKERLHALINPVLFLPNLNVINIIIEGEEKKLTYSKKTIRRNDYENICHRIVSVRNCKETTIMHLFSRVIEFKDDAGQNIKLPIYIAHPLVSKNVIDSKTTQRVYCFFPTSEDYGLKCIAHAPFILTSSREGIKQDPINSTLFKHLAKLAADSLVCLREYSENNGLLIINENIFDLIPGYLYGGYYKNEIANYFHNEYINIIKSNRLLLSRKNKYINSEVACICQPTTMIEYFTDKQLSSLLKRESVVLRIDTQKIYRQDYVEKIIKEIGIKVCSYINIYCNINANFMESQGVEWAKKFYSFLRTLTKNQKSCFYDTEIILTNNNKWVKPYFNGEPNIYLSNGTYTDDFLFISEQYIGDESCIKFFKEDLALKEPNMWDHIKTTLKKINKLDSEKYLNEFEVIHKYLQELKEKKSDLYAEHLTDVRKEFKLRAANGSLYFISSLYERSDFLDKYFDNNYLYVDNTYYADFITKYTIDVFKEFLRVLGVAIFPHINYYSENIRFTTNNYAYRRRTFFATKYDYAIAGFDNFIKRNLIIKDATLCFQIWTWVKTQYLNIHNNYSWSRIEYYYYRTRVEKETSKLINQLRNEEWVLLSNGNFVKPSDATIEQLRESGYEICDSILNFFDIKSATQSPSSQESDSEQPEEQNRTQRLEKMMDEKGYTEEQLQALIQKDIEKKEREQRRAERRAAQGTSTKSRLSESSFEEMSRSANRDMSAKPKNETPKETLEEQNERIEQEGTESINKKKDIAAMRDKIESMNEDPEKKYNKEWFDTLLELEYSSESSSSGDEYGKCDIKIDFTKFEQEKGASKFYLLSEPSRFIPYWIEDIDGLEVEFFFTDEVSQNIEFDVASVKDFTLKVKAKDSNLDRINEILNNSSFTRARVEVKAVNNILDTMKKSFANLPYDDDFNFKENLGTNLGFIFGPPGTGKTTRLAELITEKMNQPKCRILVLAPTNKACDVITTKLMEKSDDCDLWLGRFVATGEESIESAGVLIKRESDLWNNDRCCIVSTMARLPFDGFTAPENKKLKDIEWDLVIIDEASMIPLAQIVFAIYKMKNAKFIVAGDPMQIAPIVKEELWKNENIYTMVKLDNFENPQTEPIQFEIEKLNTQYRSVPAIGNLYSQYCYDNCLQHYRKDDDIKQLNFGALDVKPVTFVPFRVERFDSIFGAKKMQGSNVQVYSAIFTVEMCLYIAKQQTEDVKIGIICPYSAQAQLIKSIIEFRRDKPDNVEINVGTIHGFQGDECDIIFAVFNPPTGLKGAAERIMLNNRSIINVAISRASDYLFVLLPHHETDYYSNLVELKKLCGICNGMKKDGNVTLNNCENFEEKIFEDRAFIEKNTFVTSHQLTNVYTQSEKRYEVHIDDKSVDIQLSGDGYDE